MKTILCYGDSNTFGFNPKNGLCYPKNERWAGVLASLLGDEYEVITEGCNGRTTVFDDPVEGWKNGLNYLMPCLNSHKPVDMVIMMIGTNDLKRTFNASLDDIAAGVSRLVDEIITFGEKKQGFIPKIVLVSPPQIGENIAHSPFNDEFDDWAIERSKGFASVYKKIADEKGCIFFDAAPVAKLDEYDQLHLTEEGHRNIGEGLFYTITINKLS